jgi:hypothetical protein
MFQFPGFAFVNLCIQSTNTWFTVLLRTLRARPWRVSPASWLIHRRSAKEYNNNKVSGGLPHSEIHGSKLILSSPWLIAEYHVFHRLLLPRHPPNALFALDLIQKKQGFFCGWALLLFKPNLNQNAYIATPAAGSATGIVRATLLLLRLVYLTWNKIDFQDFDSSMRNLHPSGNPSRGAPLF